MSRSLKKSRPPTELRDEDGTVAQLRVDGAGRPVLDQFSEEGFVDSVFRIDALKRERRHYRFHLTASFGGEVVGFDCRVVRGIKAGFGAQMKIEHVYPAGIEFHRSGPESDRLVRVIAARCDIPMPKARMVSTVSFTGIALHQGALDVESQPVKIKLFGHDQPGEERRYNESFFNLDLQHRLVFWNEKDFEYRRTLLSALSK